MLPRWYIGPTTLWLLTQPTVLCSHFPASSLPPVTPLTHPLTLCLSGLAMEAFGLPSLPQGSRFLSVFPSVEDSCLLPVPAFSNVPRSIGCRESLFRSLCPAWTVGSVRGRTDKNLWAQWLAQAEDIGKYCQTRSFKNDLLRINFWSKDNIVGTQKCTQNPHARGFVAQFCLDSAWSYVRYQTRDKWLRCLFTIKMDLAARFSQRPSPPSCYRVWLAYPALYLKLL